MDDRIRYQIAMNAGKNWEQFVYDVQIATKTWGRVVFTPDPETASIAIEVMNPKSFEDLKRFKEIYGCTVTAG